MGVESITSKLITLLGKDGAAKIVRASSIVKIASQDVSEPIPGSAIQKQDIPLQISDEYTQALASINQGKQVVFVTGKAGTGKSTFIRFIREKFDPGIPVLAPTGVAALNVNGQTIHSFFQLPPRIVNPEEIKYLRNHRLFEELKVLIIDEISMVRADLMDAIDLSLRKNTGRENVPFGGVQLLLIGDLLQLPPVIASETELRYLNAQYKTPFPLSADCLQKNPPQVIILKKVYRQQDTDFIELLSNIRIGESLESTVATINSRCYNSDDSFDQDALILTPDNASANRINSRKLAELCGEKFEFEGIISGRFNIEENKLPAPKLLKLKTGSRVMFTKNDREHRWVNGTLGTVKELTNRLITIETINGTFNVNRDVWESIKYVYDETTCKIKAETIGTYTQFPLMLAWAITIHKSQGKTLNKVIIDLGNGAFAEGQVYVALSRCRSLEGIRLKRPLRVSDILVNEVVKEFYERML
jgi:ATP-dependent exoDNAse (exonuclease V) alpha subunit